MTARRLLTLLLLGLLGSASSCGSDSKRKLTIDERRVDGGAAVVSSCGALHATLDGWPCLCNTDCQVGSNCQVESYYGIPGGLCMRFCSTASPCPTGFTCGGLLPCPGNTLCSVCMPTCDTDGDCPPSRVCTTSSSIQGKFCLPICQEDKDCLGGHCNRNAGRCIDTPATGALAEQHCVRDEDCLSLVCSQSYGECVSICSTARQGCPDGYFCTATDPTDGEGVCYKRCATSADCAGLNGTLSCKEYPYPTPATVCL